MKQCVVRTYSRGYTGTIENLQALLKCGWKVKYITPFMRNGDTDYVEYILEMEQSQ